VKIALLSRVRLILATAVLALVGCGGHAAPKAPAPRTAAEVKRAFADHGIRLLLVKPTAGVRVRFTALFGQSGSLSVGVRVLRRVRAERSAPGIRSVRNVVATWQGADSPSVEASMDALR
jgi:ABC-type nitrate/sulfonate/bicarbonate transport system substrate-binding protein